MLLLCTDGETRYWLGLLERCEDTGCKRDALYDIEAESSNGVFDSHRSI